MAAGAHVPASTYRLQFSAAFTFRDAARLVPYLDALGVTHVYASPFLKVRAGSTHGCDITRPLPAAATVTFSPSMSGYHAAGAARPLCPPARCSPRCRSPCWSATTPDVRHTRPVPPWRGMRRDRPREPVRTALRLSHRRHGFPAAVRAAQSAGHEWARARAIGTFW